MNFIHFNVPTDLNVDILHVFTKMSITGYYVVVVFIKITSLTFSLLYLHRCQVIKKQSGCILKFFILYIDATNNLKSWKFYAKKDNIQEKK